MFQKSTSYQAISLGGKSSEKSKVKECLILEVEHGKVYMLENSHLVALTTKYYFDDASCCHAVNHEAASFILELLESNFYPGGAACQKQVQPVTAATVGPTGGKTPSPKRKTQSAKIKPKVSAIPKHRPPVQTRQDPQTTDHTWSRKKYQIVYTDKVTLVDVKNGRSIINYARVVTETGSNSDGADEQRRIL